MASAPPLADSVCLAALMVAGPTHGWTLARDLEPDGGLGQIWSLSRPNTYRCIDSLVEKALLRRSKPEAGKGGARVVLRVTAAGGKVARRWLDSPVSHLRDLRTELLLKLLLRDRAGLSSRSFLDRQFAELSPALDALMRTPAKGPLPPVAVWRREQARAARRFFAELDAQARGRDGLRLSARNQIVTTVASVQKGDVMTTVKMVLGDGQILTAAITTEAANDLDLAEGDDVQVVVKSTELIVAKREVIREQS